MKTFKAITLKEVELNYTITSSQQSKDPDYWLVYSPEIVSIIDEYVSNGSFPYNIYIENLVNEKLFPSMINSEENRIFSHIVYNTQSFVHERNEIENNKKFELEMTNLGYFKVTQEFLNEVAGTDKRFFVVLKGTNFFGDNANKPIEEKFKLKDWGEVGFHWMKARATRSGYKAYIGQYVKLVK